MTTSIGESKHNPGNQCGQIGRFLKVLGDKISYQKWSKCMATIWAILKNITFLEIMAVGYFLQFKEKFGQLFIPTSLVTLLEIKIPGIFCTKKKKKRYFGGIRTCVHTKHGKDNTFSS